MSHSYQSFAQFRTGPTRLRRVGCRPSEHFTTTRAELLPEFFPVLRASSRYFRLASMKLDKDERGGDRSAEIVVTMKTTKGVQVMNPTDAFHKEQRKELKRNKKERKKVREVGILKKDPESLREQIEKLERMNMKIMGSRAKLAFELRFDNPAYGLIAPALALQLVFRTEAFYSRFEEGRKARTKVIVGSNDLALQVIASVEDQKDNRVIKKNFWSTYYRIYVCSQVVSSSLPVELPISVRCSLLFCRLQVL